VLKHLITRQLADFKHIIDDKKTTSHADSAKSGKPFGHN